MTWVRTVLILRDLDREAELRAMTPGQRRIALRREQDAADGPDGADE